MANDLRYVAFQLSNHAAACQMQISEMRRILSEYFGKVFEAQKQSIQDDGHLSPLVVHSLEQTAAGQTSSAQRQSLKEQVQRDALDNWDLNRILDHLGIPHDFDADTRRQFVNEYRRADAAYARAVLDYDSSLNTYSFGLPNTATEQTTISASKADPTSLATLVAEFWKFSKLEGRWIGKTEGEKQEHVELLYEVLGRDRAADTVDHAAARKVREILTAYPVNRNKDPRTRGKPLSEALTVEGVRKLHLLTINKYLQTYKGLFNWAKQNGYCKENPFAGLSLRAAKAKKEAPRLPFSSEELSTIRDAVLDNNRNVQDHHKWGTLIAMHSGARLNEVAQLHLEDIVQVESVPCFSINQNAPTKKLKNSQSERVVPIHPRLFELGFSDYVARVQAIPGNSRLFPQLTYTPSDGYGRNLGRWFNETLLPELGIKTSQLTFHSLRHTVVRKLFAADVPQSHVTAIVGHEPGTTTLKTYNRKGFPPRQLLDALERAL